jgi:rhodanese-related sulfurtransferase
MKKIMPIIAAVLVLGAVLFWFITPENTASSSSTTPNPAQTAVAAAANGTAFLYDVRTPEEFATKHVDNAINFDVEKMKVGTLPNVPKDSTIYVYCRSGNRSAQATQILRANGFTNVSDLGGLDELKNAGVY